MTVSGWAIVVVVFAIMTVLWLTRRDLIRQKIHNLTTPDLEKHDTEEVRPIWVMRAEENIRKEVRKRLRSESEIASIGKLRVTRPRTARLWEDMSPEEQRKASEKQNKLERMVSMEAVLDNGKSIKARSRVSSTSPNVWEPELVELVISDPPSQNYTITREPLPPEPTFVPLETTSESERPH